MTKEKIQDTAVFAGGCIVVIAAVILIGADHCMFAIAVVMLVSILYSICKK